MPLGYTTVSGTALKDASGNPISNATISFQPVTDKGVPISFLAAGDVPTTLTPVTAQVTGGAFTISLADTALTSPANVGYAVKVTDNLTGASLLGPGYGCIQPSGEVWNFDSHPPDVPPQAIIYKGPTGDSAYQAAVNDGFSGTEEQWLASLVGPPRTFAGPYAPGATYAEGIEVRGSNGSYVSLVNGNHGNDPLSSPTFWSPTSLDGPSGATSLSLLNSSIAGSTGALNLLNPTIVQNNAAYKVDGTILAPVGTQFNIVSIPCAGVASLISNINIFFLSGQYAPVWVNEAGTVTGVEGACPAGTVLTPPTPDTVALHFTWDATASQPAGTLGVVQGHTLPATMPAFGFVTDLTLNAAINQVNDAIAAALPAGGALGITEMNHAIEVATGGPINRMNPADVVTDRAYRWDGTFLDGGVGVGFTATPIDVRGLTYAVCNFNFHADATYGWYFEDADGNFLPAIGYTGSGSTGTVPALIAGQTVWRVLNIPTGAATLFTFGQLNTTSGGDGSVNPSAFKLFALVAGSAVPSRVPLYGLATQDQVVDRRPGLNTKSAWYGDSYLATYWSKWLPIIESLTGTAFSVADGQGGEATAGMFGHFTAGPPAGTALHDDAWAVGTTTYLRGYTIGQTFAQIMTAGNVKYLFIALGTNDAATSPSTLAAQATANITAVRSVYPNVRIFWIGPMFCSGEPGGTLAVWKALDVALQGACDDASVPYLSMLKVSGVDAVTNAVLQRDNIHLTDAAYADMYGPTIAGWVAPFMNPA